MEGCRDKFDRQAHDVMCMLRYGSVGGGVPTKELHQVGDYLRGGPFKKPIIAIQVKTPCKPIVVIIKK